MSATYVIAYDGAIRTAMSAAGMSLAQLAERTDPPVSKSAIHQQTKPPTYRRNIELDKARAIARALGRPVDDLFAFPNGAPIGDAS